MTLLGNHIPKNEQQCKGWEMKAAFYTKQMPGFINIRQI